MSAQQKAVKNEQGLRARCATWLTLVPFHARHADHFPPAPTPLLALQCLLWDPSRAPSCPCPSSSSSPSRGAFDFFDCAASAGGADTVLPLLSLGCVPLCCHCSAVVRFAALPRQGVGVRCRCSVGGVDPAMCMAGTRLTLQPVLHHFALPCSLGNEKQPQLPSPKSQASTALSWLHSNVPQTAQGGKARCQGRDH